MKEKDIIEFAKAVGRLKRTPRTGWKMRKVKNPESVADHVFRATLLGMLIADLEKLNTEKIMRMLLLHDIAETLTGDIPLIRKYKNTERFRKEEEKSVKKIFSLLPKDLMKKYQTIWEEMENGITKEAKLCKDIDKLEMMIQAFDYEKEDKKNRKRLDVFWNWDRNFPKRYPLTKKIYKVLVDERNKNFKKRR
jgi:5'-deoxynucleotidase YfbR-like HD superfamily hydrolase